MKKILPICLLMVIGACSDTIPIPKPPTYLRLNLPEHSYKTYEEERCNFKFDLAEVYQISDVKAGQEISCNKDINLGPLNGMLYFSVIEMDKPLSVYINHAIDKVDEHKIMASAIEDFNIIRPKDRVFGTFFELQGDVASPFQFYLTDSVSRFVSGVVYLNKAPKYDSLKPSLDYLKVDLNQLVNTFNWNESISNK